MVVHFPKSFYAVVGIDLRGLQTRVPHQLLNDADIDAMIEQMGGERVSEHVRAAFALYAGPFQNGMNDTVHLAAADRSAALR